MITFLDGTLSLFTSVAQIDIFKVAVAGAVVFGIVSLFNQIVRG